MQGLEQLALNAVSATPFAGLLLYLFLQERRRGDEREKAALAREGELKKELVDAYKQFAGVGTTVADRLEQLRDHLRDRGHR